MHMHECVILKVKQFIMVYGSKYCIHVFFKKRKKKT